MGSFLVVGFELNTFAIDENGIYSIVSIDCATLESGDGSTASASQELPVEKDPLMEHGTSTHCTETEPIEYTVYQIVIYEESGTNLCYRASWYKYFPAHGASSAANNWR